MGNLLAESVCVCMCLNFRESIMRKAKCRKKTGKER